jgi:hypothetical protein
LKKDFLDLAELVRSIQSKESNPDCFFKLVGLLALLSVLFLDCKIVVCGEGYPAWSVGDAVPAEVVTRFSCSAQASALFRFGAV